MERPRRRTIVMAVVAAGAVMVVIAALVFTPWRLFVDTEVRDADPFASATAAADAPTATVDAPPPTPAATSPTSTAATATGAAPVRVGTFRSIAHPTTGTVRVGPTPDGRQVVYLEDLATDNGPDVRVFLSPHPPEGDDGIYGTDELELGPLKGNIGDQTYEVPAGTDLGRFQSVVLWCERFSVGFGVAGLVPA